MTSINELDNTVTAVPLSALTVVSLRELAELKGLSTQAIEQMLKRLLAAQAITTAKRGRATIVNIAEWDAAVARVIDPVRIEARKTAKANRSSEPMEMGSLTEEQTRRAKADADLKEIEIGKRKGTLLEIEDVRDAMQRCAEIVVREIDRMPLLADQLLVASKKGVPGLRELLKARAREIRAALAASMSLTAGENADE